jgi:amidophosphoribosyltransferase
MPSVNELIAHNRSEEEVAKLIGADWLIYQDLDDLVEAVSAGNPDLKNFDLSCFNGEYVTGDINQDYLDHIDQMRNDGAKSKRGGNEENLIDLSNSV